MLDKIKNIFKPKKIILSDGREIQPPTPIAPFVILGLVLAIIVSANVTGFNFETIIKRGNQFFVILKDMFPSRFWLCKGSCFSTYRNNKNFYFRIYDW